MYLHIKENPDSVKKIKVTLPAGAEIYHFLETTLERNIGIVMVVEKKTPELEEIIDSISANMNLQSHILEFITYQNNKGKKIHLLDMLPVISIQPKKSQNAEVMTWDTRMERATPQIKELVMKLISDAKARLECVGTSWFKNVRILCQ